MTEPCPICFEALAAEPQVARTPCGHRFCLRCLDQWVDTTACCPLCREPISTVALLQHCAPPMPEGEIAGWLTCLGSELNTPAIAPVFAIDDRTSVSLWSWLCRAVAPEQCSWSETRLVRVVGAADAAILDANVAAVRVGATLLLKTHFATCQAWVHDVCVSARRYEVARYPVGLGPAVMDLFVATLARSTGPPLKYQAILVAAIHYAALQLRCLIRAESHRGFVRSLYPDAVPAELDRAEAAVRPLQVSVLEPFATLPTKKAVALGL